MKLYVGNLSFDTTDSSLRAAFEPYGAVASAEVIIDRDTGRSRGFGFVEMPETEHANAAIAGLNGTSLQGRELNVNQARDRNDRGPAGGGGSRGGGGYGGGGGGGGGNRRW